VTFDSLSQQERGELRIVDFAGLKKLVAEHKGSPVALAAWAATREGGPAFYRQLAAFAAQDGSPAVIALNLDGPATVREKVVALARQHGAGITTCALNDDQMMLLGLVDPAWTGQSPALWLFDAAGSLTTSLYGAEALERIRAARPEP
jgi:hypothetical protein